VDYTPIGDTVNVASRLEELTKEYHASIIINGALYNAIDPRSFNLRHIDRIRVKGKEQPVDIYEEFSSNSPRIRDLKHKMAPRYQELQEMYFSGQNQTAAIALAERMLDQINSYVRAYNLGTDSIGDHLPLIYRDRMKFLQKNPELIDGWDGVYTFIEK
jgi:hypothetical protein